MSHCHGSEIARENFGGTSDFRQYFFAVNLKVFSTKVRQFYTFMFLTKGVNLNSLTDTLEKL